MTQALLLTLLLAACAFGQVKSGLRLNLAVTVDRGDRWLELTFENTTDRPMYLPMGNVTDRHLQPVRLTMSLRGGAESTLTPNAPGNGAAPSRVDPLIVPLLARSSYVWRSRLAVWELDKVEPGSAVIRARVTIPPPRASDIAVLGLQLYWSGEVVSNPLKL